MPSGAGVEAIPVRVALFTGNYNHIADGVSRTLNRAVAYLEKVGASVLVFGPTVDDPPMRHAGELVPVPSVAAPGRGEYRVSVRFPRSAQARLEAFAPTLVHIATPDVLGVRALRWARREGVPVVSSYHTHFASYLKYYRLHGLEPVVWRYMRWFYGQCEQIYVPSPSMADVLRAHGIQHGLRIWERGVRTDHYHPRNRDLSWRRVRGLADDDIVVTFISRLVWEKGLSVYVDVVTRLREAGFPIRALIVGEGPARAGLEAQLPDDSVFTGYLEGEDLARAFACSDVFLFPSDTETFGNVTLEAMASGVPAVCADATGSATLVNHGTTGLLARPRDVDDFFEHTLRLVADAGLRASFGAAARQAAEPYDWDVVLARLHGYYREVLSASDVREEGRP